MTHPKQRAKGRAEEWRYVVGYGTSYSVSSLGRIRSNAREVDLGGGKIQRRNERFLVITLNRNGYPVIGLSQRATVKTHTVHRLVAIAFIDNPLGKPSVNHKDGKPTHNSVENLEWATFSENIRHARRVLNQCVGENAFRAKITNAQASVIRARHDAGESIYSLAKAYGYKNHSTVSKIIHRKSYFNTV